MRRKTTWSAIGLAALALGGAIAPAGARDKSSEPALRLTVQPRSATVNRRTSFHFRVVTGGGSPVPGATVRFARRTARTGPAGRAKIVTTLHRARTFTARATRKGFRTARRKVKARTTTGPIGFDGTCDGAGPVRFDPPLTNTPQPITQSVHIPGTCSGTVVDRAGRPHEIDNQPAKYVATEYGDRVSCGSGSDSGTGVLIFPGVGRLHFSAAESRAGGVAVLTLRGAHSGSAFITGSISPDEDQAAILEACAGAGLKEVDLQAQLSTNGTISG
ncbi:MAG: hypothetical protein QOG86_496 [Thermoleophilaceae bacterium]|nr:hypothetical protein [Thermoleophilaceae bacterium]